MIGYSFVACDPRTLECERRICFACKSKVDNACVICSFCGASATKGDSGETIFANFLNDLTRELRDTYQNALRIYEGIMNEMK